MTIGRQNTLLSLIFVFCLSISVNSFAADELCWVKSNIDTTVQSASGYGDSFRSFVKSLQSSSNCQMAEETSNSNYEPSEFKRSILFDTPEVVFSTSDAAIRTINLESSLEFDASKKTVIGNWSVEAINESAISDLYSDTNANQFITSDYGYIAIDVSSFPEKDSNFTESDLPIKCSGDSKDIYFRNIIFVLPAGYSKSDIVGNGLNGGSLNLTSCFKNAGDLHFCAGTLKKSNGNIIDPNSGQDWCEEAEIEEGCDDDEKITYYKDEDGDTYGRSFIRRQPLRINLSGATSTITFLTKRLCPGVSPGPGWVTNNDDCDDNDFEIKPGATEDCDGKDNNCDGIIDGLTQTNDLKTEYYLDSDADGFGDASQTTLSCDTSAPANYVSDNTDCDDSQATTYPGAPETCNNLDDNCDGDIDNSAIDPSLWYQDRDGDGFGNDDNITQLSCEAPIGFVSNQSDCEDTNGDIKPGATEICNNKDDNCDGLIDEGLSCDPAATDQDSDGFDSTVDCNDANASIYPGATEICDGTDNNCDGDIDENLECEDPEPIEDEDQDGFDKTVDCDDFDSEINPNAIEICDTVDNNCDGQTNENLTDCDIKPEEIDLDGDGFTADVDCNDNEAGISPEADEICLNDIDDNCDGSKDFAPCIFPEIIDPIDGSAGSGGGCSLSYSQSSHNSGALILLFLMLLGSLRWSHRTNS